MKTILYGAGTACGMAIALYGTLGTTVQYICDKKKTGFFEKAGVKIPIISPETLVRDFSDSKVIITSWKFENEIRRDLINIGFTEKNIESFTIPPRMSAADFKINFENLYKSAYDFYDDEISKQTVLSRAMSYSDSLKLKPNIYHPAYYPPEFEFSENEVFLDGGASDGDTVREFIKMMNGKYRHIYAFEPDPLFFEGLSINTENTENIDIIDAALYDRNGEETLYYDGLMASGITDLPFFLTNRPKFSDSPYKTKPCKTFSIDGYFGENPDKPLPTFIKLDVEGAEKEALLGAERTIKAIKPKIAVSAFYFPADVYYVANVIKNIRSDYKFKLRQYDYGYYETVLYAY
jgi:FkbM family methyltransferase